MRYLDYPLTRDELQYRTNLQVSHNNLQISIFLENEKVKIEREREREQKKKGTQTIKDQ